jgi:hypothetical protein
LSNVLNHYNNLQAISSDTPEGLVTLIRQIRVPIEHVGITAGPGIHTFYFRSTQMVQVVNGKPDKVTPKVEAD